MADSHTAARLKAWYATQASAEDIEELVDELESVLAQLAETREALVWYAERRNYAPAGGESAYDALMARDAFDGFGPGARARAALAAPVPAEKEPHDA